MKFPEDATTFLIKRMEMDFIENAQYENETFKFNIYKEKEV